MINLLPPAVIKNNNRDYRERVGAVIGFFIACLCLVTIIALAVLFLVLRDTRQATERSVVAATGVETAEFNEMEKILEQTVKRLKNLEPIRENRRLTQTIAILFGHKTVAIRFTEMDFRTAREGESGSAVLEVKGWAATRNDLLNLVAGLEQEASLSKVVSPVSNLIKDRELRFDLTLEFAS